MVMFVSRECVIVKVLKMLNHHRRRLKAGVEITPTFLVVSRTT